MLSVSYLSDFGTPSIAPPDAPRLKRALRAFAQVAQMPKLDPGSVTGSVDMKTLAAVLHLTKFFPHVIPLDGLVDLADVLSDAAPYLDFILPWVQKALAISGASQIPYIGEVAADIVEILNTIKGVVTTASGGIALAIELYIIRHGGPLVDTTTPQVAQVVQVVGLVFHKPIVPGGNAPSGAGAGAGAIAPAFPPGTIATPLPGGGYRVAIPRAGKY